MRESPSAAPVAEEAQSSDPTWRNPVWDGPFVDQKDLYRLPWSLHDNPIGWLELTDQCDLSCRGCYRKRLEGHKDLDRIKEEIDLFKQKRNTGCIVLAGGEPTLHPQVLETIAYINEKGMLPHLTTGGQRLLDPAFLKEMRRAGLEGMGVHVDSKQGRPGWVGSTEIELNALREEMAQKVLETGGMNCGFGITVYEDNLADVPALSRWAVENRHRVSGFSFIAYRAMPFRAGVKYGVRGRPVEVRREDIGYATLEEQEVVSITAREILAGIQEGVPEFEPCAFLGGTRSQQSVKWLVGVLLATRGKVLGSLGARTMEIGQTLHHLISGTYYVYSRGQHVSRAALLTGLFDRKTRKAWRHYRSHPWRIFRRLYGVGFGIVQPPDLLPDGSIDMCDSCPDMTVHEGQLVNSCRMDEYRVYGDMLTPMLSEGA